MHKFKHTIEMLLELIVMAFVLYGFYVIWLWSEAFEPLASYAQ